VSKSSSSSVHRVRKLKDRTFSALIIIIIIIIIITFYQGKKKIIIIIEFV